MQYSLLLFAALLSFLALAKDWKAHATRRRRICVLVLILVSLGAGIVNTYWTSKKNWADKQDLYGRIDGLKKSVADEKQNSDKITAQLDAANGTLGQIRDCFNLKVDPEKCGIFAEILTRETLAGKKTTYAPTYAGFPVGLELDEQREMLSQDIRQLAADLRQGYKTQILDPRDQMQKGAGQTPFVLTGSAATERLFGEAATMKKFLVPLLPQVQKAVAQASRVVPPSDAPFTAAKQDIRGKCTIDIPNVNLEFCADSLENLAALIKSREENL